MSPLAIQVNVIAKETFFQKHCIQNIFLLPFALFGWPHQTPPCCFEHKYSQLSPPLNPKLRILSVVRTISEKGENTSEFKTKQNKTNISRQIFVSDVDLVGCSAGCSIKFYPCKIQQTWHKSQGENISAAPKYYVCKVTSCTAGTL